MADTPDVLGAAETAFNEAETNFTESETSFTAAQDAYKADETDEALKTAFTNAETAFKTATETRDSTKTALDELKASSVKGYWPEDWKEKYVEKQEGLDDAGKDKLMKRLSRYASPRAALDAMVNAQNKISKGMTKIPGKDATKEEIAQYRKDIGVPDDVKGYDLTLSDGMVIGDDDKEAIDAFLETAHAGNYNQQQVTDGLNWYYKQQEAIAAAQQEADAIHRAEVVEQLRTEWGPEYQANRNLMANYLTSDFGEGVAEMITGARLADGTPFANHPDILRGFVAKARAANPLGALVPGSGTKQHDAMVDEIAALEKQMSTPEWSSDTKAQKRYQKLISIRDGIPEN